MYVAVGLMVSTGIPWEYWARQDDEVIATALDVLKQIHGKGGGKPAAQSTPGVLMGG